MRYVAAYCLAVLGGGEPSAKDIEKVLGAVGINCDAASAKKVVEELGGKNLQNVIAEGMGKIGSVPVGGGAPGRGGASAAPAADTARKAAAAPAKEEKPPEPEEESDEDMGFGLFD